MCVESMKLFMSVQMSPLRLSLIILSCFEIAVSQQLRGGGEVSDAFLQQAGTGQAPPMALPLQQPLNSKQSPFSGAQLLQASAAPALSIIGAPSEPPQQAVTVGSDKAADCQCDELNKTLPEALKVSSSAVGNTCSISKVTVHQDHPAKAGMSLASISAVWGSSTLSPEQRDKVTLAQVSETSFHCLDDRVTQPSIFTPGGDLGEFILALSSFLQERDPTGKMLPSQEVVDTLLSKYLDTIPASRPMIHCTDDRAISHLEAEMPMENLDLTKPPDHVRTSLLEKLTEVENHGDSHIRLLLKKPEWFELNQYLVPMAVKSFYRLLWKQSSDESSPLHKVSKLKLEVLVGQSDPMAFLEVSSGELCHHGGVAPMLTARAPRRAVLVSHLDAVSLRREELASFFTQIANASPRKINKGQLHQRLDRHGLLALETTGSRIAAGLPFYTLSYT